MEENTKNYVHAYATSGGGVIFVHDTLQRQTKMKTASALSYDDLVSVDTPTKATRNSVFQRSAVFIRSILSRAA